MNPNASERARMMNDINVIDFTLTELRLYLDTHPYDRDAMQYFQHYSSMLQKVIHEYTVKYGPIDANNVGGCMEEWKWATDPMPWEGGNC